MTDVTLITEKSHPTLFKAFELISHDSGRQAGHKNYAIPMSYDSILPVIEQCLGGLSAQEFETLCIGEDAASRQVADEYGLWNTDKLLQEFFEEFR